MGPQPVVLTVGYEGRTLDELVALLRGHGVELVVDVREHAVSRRPGMSKRRLGDALTGAGIGYRHEPALGNPKENRPGFQRGGPARSAARARYLDRVRREAGTALDALQQLVLEQRVALLCFEQDPAGCHRSCLVDELQRRRPELEHTPLAP